jgi:hypothetical protein
MNLAHDNNKEKFNYNYFMVLSLVLSNLLIIILSF